MGGARSPQDARGRRRARASRPAHGATPPPPRHCSRPRRRRRRATRDRGGADAEAELAASAVAGRDPPAGPQWLRGLAPLAPQPLAYDKPLCASLDGFTLHAATRAGALDAIGREALLRYVLRPPIAQERVEPETRRARRITLKRAYADGTVAVDMDPLSLLCRLATSVPPPRFHTVKYAGVLAPASRWRARIRPRPSPRESTLATMEEEERPPKASGTYRPWAELFSRTFAIDVLECPTCKGRMKLVAMVTEPREHHPIPRRLGEPTDVPTRSPSRGPPYWKSTVLRRKALGDIA